MRIEIDRVSLYSEVTITNADLEKMGDLRNKRSLNGKNAKFLTYFQA